MHTSTVSAADANLLLDARHVSKSYHKHKVLSDVSLSVHKNEVLTLVGLNGSGKTTLLEILLGLERPDSGEVHRKPGLRIGYMPQKMILDSILPLTVEWFLDLSLPAVASPPWLNHVCEETTINHLRKQSMHTLSGGELQRVLLARALLCDPQLLVLDEPVQGVDIAGQAALYSMIARISEEHRCAVLMVSHELHLVMASTNRVVCLNHHICCEGTPHQVRSDPAFAALFGSHVADSLALYTHHHDHTHDLSGDASPAHIHRHRHG